ncbi:hypothetical protein [Ralstonia pseudosolanacearum]
MKKNKKMSSTKVNVETRISARISNSLYLAMRFIASSQSMTIEEKIAEMCKNEVAYTTRQKWFIELVEKGGADDIIPLLELLDKRKKAATTKGSSALDSSDFDSNNVNGDDSYDKF